MEILLFKNITLWLFTLISCWLCLGADGSVRMFDLRHLEHSTIIYEDVAHQPLLRLAWNKQDPNYLATFAMDAAEVGVSHR